MKLRIDFASIGTAGWTTTNVGNTTGNKLTNIIDRDTGLPTNLSLDVIVAFGGVTASSALTAANEYGVPELVWDRYAAINGSTTPSYVIYNSDLIVGHQYSVKFVGVSPTAGRTLRMTCNGVQADYVNPGGTTPLSEGAGTLAAPQTLTTLAVNDGIYGPSLIFTVTNITDSIVLGHNWIEIDYVGPVGPTATITDLDGGNTTSQYQLKTANVTGFTETIVSGTLDVTPLLDVVDNEDGTVSFRAPGNLSSGTYDLTLNGSTETATLTGVVHTQTHAIPAPTFPVDTLSVWNGQGWTESDEDVYWYGPALPAELSFIGPVSGWNDADTSAALSTYMHASPGYTGTLYLTFNRIYSDGTTAGWTVEVVVEDGVIVDVGQVKPQTRSQVRLQVVPQTFWEA